MVHSGIQKAEPLFRELVRTNLIILQIVINGMNQTANIHTILQRPRVNLGVYLLPEGGVGVVGVYISLSEWTKVLGGKMLWC